MYDWSQFHRLLPGEAGGISGESWRQRLPGDAFLTRYWWTEVHWEM